MSTKAPRIAALVLAAGQGRRFGVGGNKLLADLDGRPLLRSAVEAALGSKLWKTIVVTGHDRAAVETALAGLPIVFAHNPSFADGLATSLRAGLDAAADADGVLVLLGDMPGVSPRIISTLVDAFGQARSSLAVVPTRNGRRGNPVLLARGLFQQVRALQGDEGARRLLSEIEGVIEVAVDDDAVLVDVDRPADLDACRLAIRRD